MGNIVATKTVNALIPEAEMGFAAKFILDKAGVSATGPVLEVAKKLMGGLWVGGTVAIEERALVFRPNLLNRLVHKSEYTVTIPFKEIFQVNVRLGFVTKITDVVTADGRFSFRCYGAEAFADLLRKQL